MSGPLQEPTPGQIQALKSAISICRRANVAGVDQELLGIAWRFIRRAERFRDGRAVHYAEAWSCFSRAHKGNPPKVPA